ncbi:hypothetical protein EJ04DRAFT_573217 [Polyplosphaeria fusca]|uniref:SPT2 chromatin protein n=1 Tax=Polyplosphaeria fusca TaxID=682080 RepID=A0A9P4R985_9PLEO|nr:hypothetical protein EJ04DRAFT_573217 [Polyplosphaeria fusca]
MSVSHPRPSASGVTGIDTHLQMFNSLLSSIDPTAAARPPSNPRQTQGTTAARSAPGPPANGQGRSQPQPQPQLLKRKADGQLESDRVKAPRKDGPVQPERLSGGTRPAGASDANRPRMSTPTSTYRGTAGLQSARSMNMVAKKSVSAAGTQAPPAPKPAPHVSKLATASASTTTTANPAPKKTSYAAMLAKAKESQQSKPLAPPVKHEPTKLLTKKERLALREEAKARAKGKTTGLVGPASRPGNARAEITQEKRKPAEPTGYQGTARPTKKPAESTYKGTARPLSTACSAPGSKKPGAAMGKPSAQQGKKRLDHYGYADWDDLDALSEEEGEDNYDSDASSDMEGGAWDLEEEEERALKAARQEDAEALREENELKRAKEERKRKLAQMNKAAAAKKKF